MVYLSKPTTEIYPAVGCCNIPCSLPFSKPRTKLASKINYLASNCCNAQQDACQSKVLLMEDTSHDPKGKMSSDRSRALVRTQLLKLMCKGSETRTRSATQRHCKAALLQSRVSVCPCLHTNGLVACLGWRVSWTGVVRRLCWRMDSHQACVFIQWCRFLLGLAVKM